MGSYVTKSWADRESTYPSRRRLTPTAETNVYDVTREEGTVTAIGDAFSKTTMDDLETRINNFSDNTLSYYYLYDNISGTNSTINLSDSTDNFTYLEIYFITDTNVLDMVKIYSPNGKKAVLSANNYYQETMYVKGAYVNISGTSITWSDRGWLYSKGGSITTVSSNNTLKITRVLGLK